MSRPPSGCPRGRRRRSIECPLLLALLGLIACSDRATGRGYSAQGSFDDEPIDDPDQPSSPGALVWERIVPVGSPGDVALGVGTDEDGLIYIPVRDDPAHHDVVGLTAAGEDRGTVRYRKTRWEAIANRHPRGFAAVHVGRGDPNFHPATLSVFDDTGLLVWDTNAGPVDEGLLLTDVEFVGDRYYTAAHQRARTFVAAFDDAGEVWRYEHGREGANLWSVDCNVMAGCVAVGQTEGSWDGDLLVVRLSLEGEVLWTYEGPRDTRRSGLVGAVFEDGSVVVLGSRTDTTPRPMMWTLDATGALEAEIPIAESSGDAVAKTFTDAVTTAEGRIAFIGDAAPRSDYEREDLWFGVLDRDGTVRWDEVRGSVPGGRDSGAGVSTLPSGDLVFVGSLATEAHGLAGGEFDVWVARYGQ